MQAKKPWLASFLNEPWKPFVVALACWPICCGVFGLCLWLGTSWEVAFFICLPLCSIGMALCLLSAFVRHKPFGREYALVICTLLLWGGTGLGCFRVYHYVVQALSK